MWNCKCYRNCLKMFCFVKKWNKRKERSKQFFWRSSFSKSISPDRNPLICFWIFFFLWKSFYFVLLQNSFLCFFLSSLETPLFLSFIFEHFSLAFKITWKEEKKSFSDVFSLFFFVSISFIIWRECISSFTLKKASTS